MGIPPAVVPAVRRLPGMHLVALARHRLRAPRDPGRTERSPGASQQARSPRARVRDRPHRARPTDTGARSIPPLARSTAPCTWPRAATTSRTGARIAIDRQRPAVCSTQAGCRRGTDGIFSCGGRAALVALRDERRESDSSAGASADPGAASGCGCRGPAGVRSPRRRSSAQILPQGDVRRRTVHVGRRTGCDRGPPSTAAAGSQNFTGYCQRLVTAHLNQAERILDDRRRASVLNEADRGLASDVPTIPLFQFIFTAAYDTSVRNFVFLPWNPLWNAENWWLAE